jgi:hypothetical protein
MRAIQIHFHDRLNNQLLDQVRTQLLSMPYISNVEIESGKAQDLLVEFEEHHNIPMSVMDVLHHQGFHPDITSC